MSRTNQNLLPREDLSYSSMKETRHRVRRRFEQGCVMTYAITTKLNINTGLRGSVTRKLLQAMDSDDFPL